MVYAIIPIMTGVVFISSLIENPTEQKHGQKRGEKKVITAPSPP